MQGEKAFGTSKNFVSKTIIFLFYRTEICDRRRSRRKSLHTVLESWGVKWCNHPRICVRVGRRVLVVHLQISWLNTEKAL